MVAVPRIAGALGKYLSVKCISLYETDHENIDWFQIESRVQLYTFINRQTRHVLIFHYSWVSLRYDISQNN